MKGFLFFSVMFVTLPALSKSAGIPESIAPCKSLTLNQKKEVRVRFNHGCMQCHQAKPVVSYEPLNKTHDDN